MVQPEHRGRQALESIRRYLESSVIALLLLSYAVLFWNSLTGRAGISYDEAWNYAVLSSRGVLYSLTNYPAPNNHLLTTALNGLLPPTWVTAFPPLMRLFLPLYVGIFVYASWLILHRNLRWPPATALLAALAVPLSSSSMGLYVVWMRGYLPGTAFLLMGIHHIAAALSSTHRTRSLAGALLWFSLATWCLPTFLLPIWTFCGLASVYAFFARGTRPAVETALLLPLSLLVMLILYSGVLSQMLGMARDWKTDWSLAEALRLVLPRRGQASRLAVIVVPALCLFPAGYYLFRDFARQKRAITARSHASSLSAEKADAAEKDAPSPVETSRSLLLLILLIGSFISVVGVECAVRLGVIPPPFLRNVGFIAPFFWLGLMLLPGRPGKAALLATLIIVPMTLQTMSLLAGNPEENALLWNLDAPDRISSLDRLLMERNADPPAYLTCNSWTIHLCMIHARRWKIPVYAMEVPDDHPVDCDRARTGTFLAYPGRPDRQVCR